MNAEEISENGSGYSPPVKVSDLVEIAGRMKPMTVIIAGGDRVEDLQLVESARDHGIVDRLVLIGNEHRIRTSIEKIGIEVQSEDIVSAGKDEEVARKTVELVQAGGIDIILKGNISTPVLNRCMLKLAVQPTASLVSIFDAAPIADGRPIILTDAGFTTVCNFGRMSDLIRNAVLVARTVMGIERPRVAVLSANEKIIPSLPSSWIGAKLAERKWENAVVYGPLSFDLATDPESVAVKGLKDIGEALQVAGKADILVCPGIDAANILYKTITAMVKFGNASLAGVTVGFTVPYIILSRADALSTRLESIALSSIYAQQVAAQQVAANMIAKQGVAVQQVEKQLTVAKKTTRRRKEGPSEIKAWADVSPRIFRIVAFMLTGCKAKAAFFESDRIIEEKEIELTAGKSVRDGAKKESAGIAASEIGAALETWKTAGIDEIAIWGGPSLWRAGKPAAPDRLHVQAAEEVSRSLGIHVNIINKLPIVINLFDAEEINSAESIISAIDLLASGEAALQAAQEVGRPIADINLIVANMEDVPLIAAIRKGTVTDYILTGSAGKPVEAAALSRAVEPFSYRISKSIGALCAAAECDIEAIIICGTLARSNSLVKKIRERVSRLAPVLVFREPLALKALARAASASLRAKALRAVNGEKK